MSATPALFPVTIPTPPRRSMRPMAAVAWLATGLAVVLGAVMFVPAVIGMQRYVITGGSMSGTYDRGSVVFEQEVAPAQLRVGDVITYDPPGDAGPKGLVTHRIATITGSGRDRIYGTKGDANQAADPWRFTLTDPTQARVVFSVPLIGYAVAALSDRTVRMLVIGLPALLIALGVLAALWRDADPQAARRRHDSQAAEVPAP